MKIISQLIAASSLLITGCGSGGTGGAQPPSSPPVVCNLTLQSAALVSVDGVPCTNPQIFTGAHRVRIHTTYAVGTLGYNLTGAGKLTFAQDGAGLVIVTFTATDENPCFLALWQLAPRSNG